MPSKTQDKLPSTFDDGDLYDVLLGNFDYGFEFYLDLAQAANGPVLDVACGTGRVMIPCLRLGLDIEGLDLYDGMLDRLRRKAAAEGLHPRLHRADMSDFRLTRQFFLIMIPFNAFIHNMTADAQIRCLTLCREHLLPGGLLAFDTFFPGREIIMATDGARVLEGEIAHLETGLPVRMYDTRSFDRVEQTQRSINEVEFLDAAGNVVETRRSECCSRFIYKSEMELLLLLSGFARWQISGGFDRRPLVNETDAMIVEAWSPIGC
jgi:SAM-dependent methyltransferase